jgi:V/A-type H+-transporting ATPase subunit I
MKKVCLVVQEKLKDEALVKLRDVGVIHLEKKDTPQDNSSQTYRNKAKAEEALGLISEFKVPKKKKNDKEGMKPGIERRAKPKGLHRGRRAADVFGTEYEEPFSLSAVRAAQRPYLPDLLVSLGEKRKALKEQDITLSREVNRIEGWGDFDPSIVEEINAYGIPVFLYELTPDVFLHLDKNIRFIKVKSEKSIVRILVLDEKIPGINSFVLPAKRLSLFKEELEEHKEDLLDIEDRLESFSDRRLALTKEMDDIEIDLEFESAVAGMKKIEDIPEELGLCWLTGFVPKDDLDNVKEVAKENDWALSAYDPADDDSPPTKLANNPLVRIIHPLLSFLGTIPGYKEFDISPSYLFFFSIFFAMILGDAGYGMLILALAVLIGINNLKKSGTFPDVVKLLMLLAATTVIWGAINGAWFAIPRENLPFFLSALIIPPFNNIGPVVEFPLFLQNVFKLPEEVPYDIFKTRWNIQFLCFSLAVTQLVWGRGKRIMNTLPSLSAVAQFGTLIMMLGLYFLVLNMLLGIEFPPFALVLIITGVVFNLVFAEQNGGNFFVNMGKGFGNFFSLFLKTVSCFADIISYIRLFAVGLAGAMIAQIFNDMAMPVDGFGGFGLAFLLKLVTTVLILVIGHGLNLALTALSVIVHGVRLNLLEYAGNHLEMEWSGYLYKPFALKQKKE